jgi:hypothetical protein
VKKARWTINVLPVTTNNGDYELTKVGGTRTYPLLEDFYTYTDVDQGGSDRCKYLAFQNYKANFNCDAGTEAIDQSIFIEELAARRRVLGAYTGFPYIPDSQNHKLWYTTTQWYGKGTTGYKKWSIKAITKGIQNACGDIEIKSICGTEKVILDPSLTQYSQSATRIRKTVYDLKIVNAAAGQNPADPVFRSIEDLHGGSWNLHNVFSTTYRAGENNYWFEYNKGRCRRPGNTISNTDLFRWPSPSATSTRRAC